VDQLFQAPHRRINQICKEDGKEKKNQRTAGGVEEAQPNGKKEGREQDARGA